MGYDDIIVLRRAGVFLLQPADALEHLLVLLDGALFVQSAVEFFQGRFKALGEALLNTLLFFLAQVGVAIQLHLALCVNHALNMNTKLIGVFNQHRICLIELPMAFAAHYEIAVMIFYQPSDVLLGGNPRIQHHCRLSVLCIGCQLV